MLLYNDRPESWPTERRQALNTISSVSGAWPKPSSSMYGRFMITYDYEISQSNPITEDGSGIGFERPSTLERQGFREPHRCQWTGIQERD